MLEDAQNLIKLLFFFSVSENDFKKLDIYNTEPKTIGGNVYLINADFEKTTLDSASFDKLKF